jgi:hypothetical protein
MYVFEYRAVKFAPFNVLFLATVDGDSKLNTKNLDISAANDHSMPSKKLWAKAQRRQVAAKSCERLFCGLWHRRLGTGFNVPSTSGEWPCRACFAQKRLDQK